jgi:hypothetical protein
VKEQTNLHSPTQAGQDAGGHRACTAAAQGTPRCAATTCPQAAAASAASRAAETGDLHASTDYAITHHQQLPPHHQAGRFASSGRRHDSTSEPAAAEFGRTCGGIPTVPAGTSRDLYLMFHTCRYMYMLALACLACVLALKLCTSLPQRKPASGSHHFRARPHSMTGLEIPTSRSML